MTRRAVQTGDATLAGVQTRDANRPRGLYHGVIRVVALGHAALALKQQRVRTGYAVIFRRTGAGLAGRVTELALAVLVVLARVAVAATLGRAQPLFVQAPALDAADATQRGAGRATGRTCDAFAPLLVGAVTRRARGATCACNIRTRNPAYDIEYRGNLNFSKF